MRASAQKLFLGRFGGFRGFSFAGIALGVFAAEAFDATGRIHELLFAGKERMAGGADFYGDVTLVGGTGYKGIAASAMHADFTIVRMSRCFHVGPLILNQTFDSTGVRKDSAR